jgi:hypothetical protein
MVTKAIGLAGGLKYCLPESAVEPAVGKASELVFCIHRDSLGCYHSKK